MNNPELYAQNNDVAYSISEFIMKKYGKRISWKENGTIMDVGIGDGNITKKSILPRIKSNFTQYAGIDISEDFLNIAKQTLNQDSRFEFVKMDIETNIVPNDLIGKFDNILSLLTLHWVRNTRKSFQNINKMLKPNGEMFLVYFAKVPIDYAFTELDKNPRWAKYDHRDLISPYFHSSDPLKECEEDLIAAGIKNYDIKLENMVSFFPSEDNFKNLLYSVNPMLMNVPQGEVEDYKRDYVKYALEKGGYFESYEHGKKVIGSIFDLFIIHAKK